MKRNIRFYDYINGAAVKITLKPNQVLQWGESHNTDEGWESNECTWRHDGECVTLECVNDGADCDGRLTRSAMYILDGLRSQDFEREQSAIEYRAGVQVSEHISTMANWKDLSHSQRDYTAESMGY